MMDNQLCAYRVRSSALNKYCTNRGHEQVDIKNYNILLHLKICDRQKNLQLQFSGSLSLEK